MNAAILSPNSLSRLSINGFHLLSKKSLWQKSGPYTVTQKTGVKDDFLATAVITPPFFPSPISPCSAFIVRHTVPKCSLFLYHASTYTLHIMCAHSLPLNNHAEKELGLRVMAPDCLAQNMFQERKEITAEFHMEMLLLGGMKSTSSSPQWVSFDRFLPGTKLQERGKVCASFLAANPRSPVCTSSSMW